MDMEGTKPAANVTGVLAAIAIFVGLGLLVGALATPEWAQGHDREFDVKWHVGLWTVCTEPGECGEIANQHYFPLGPAMKTVRALIILAVLFASIALVSACIYLVAASNDNEPSTALRVTPLLAGLLTLISTCIGVFIFARHDKLGGGDYDHSYSYSFVLTIVGALLAAVAGIVFFNGAVEHRPNYASLSEARQRGTLRSTQGFAHRGTQRGTVASGLGVGKFGPRDPEFFFS